MPKLKQRLDSAIFTYRPPQTTQDGNTDQLLDVWTFADEIQVRYGPEGKIPGAKSAKSRGSYLRVSFKNTRETAQAINGWKLERALKYLENVQELKEAVPMRRYAGGTGRSAQGMQIYDSRKEISGMIYWRKNIPICR